MGVSTLCMVYPGLLHDHALLLAQVALDVVQDVVQPRYTLTRCILYTNPY